MKEKDFENYLNPSLYKILYIDKSAPEGIIKSSYRALSLTEHPDVSVDSTEIAEKKFLKIKDAYDVLSNPELKKKYDLLLDKYETSMNAKIIEEQIAKGNVINDYENTKVKGYADSIHKDMIDALKEGLDLMKKAREGA